MILLIKSCNLEQTQFEPIISTKLYALATLIMGSYTVEEVWGKNLAYHPLPFMTMSQEQPCKMNDYI